MDYINFILYLLSKDDTKVLFMIGLIMILDIVDFIFGYLFALFDKNKEFSTSRATIGILKKIGCNVMLILVLPISLIAGDIGLGALYFLYTGYIFATFTSIMENIGLGDQFKDIFNIFVSNFTDKK